MALLIERNTTILGNIDLSELYIRFRLEYNINGNQFELFNETYPSRIAYDTNANGIEVDGIPKNTVFTYDRAVDGNDLLTAAHNKLKGYLSTDVSALNYLYYETNGTQDPSTLEWDYQIGDPQLDPSTGEQLTEVVITLPKFTEDSSISFIDID